MSDIGTNQATGAAGALSRLGESMRRGDVALALGVVFILVALILPMPKWLLDICLAISITFSVLVLMTCLFISRPLDFSAFPTVLLIATMLRLSLNLASTRLILANGHEGTAAAGHVIEAFGGFVMSGNFVIGIIVFAILVIVNFVVITKGSGRIAEVAARFSLDAMPGKQMAIDADLSAGLIDETSARARRKDLEDESTFFGAMDGAAKFVRGDAIAGLLITFINIIGGIIIGVGQMGLSFSQASQSYTMLTVGDGLVSQIPALIVSTAAGMLVSKAGAIGTTDKAIFGQLGGYPRAMALSSFLMFALALLPGIPMLPFLSLSALTGFGAWQIFKRQAKAEEDIELKEQEARQAAPAEEPISTALALDQLRLELGYGLLPLINDNEQYMLTDQIKALRRQLANEMGFVMPSVRIQDNMQLPANTYCIRVKESEAGRGDLRPNQLLVMDPRGEPITLPGEETREPTFGLPASVDRPHHARGSHVPRLYGGRSRHRDHHPSDRGHQGQHGGPPVLRRDAEAAGRPAQGAAEAGRRPGAEPDLGERHPARAAEPAGRAHLDPRPADHPRRHRRGHRLHPEYRADHRACAHPPRPPDQPRPIPSPEGYHPDHRALARLGDGVCRGAGRPGRGKAARHGPGQASEIHHGRAHDLRAEGQRGLSAGPAHQPDVWPYVRSIIERFRPSTVVMSQNEVHPKARLKSLGQVNME